MVARSAAAATTPASCERPPTLALIAVRESEAVIGKAENRPAAMLAAPKPSISRSASTG